MLIKLFNRLGAWTTAPGCNGSPPITLAVSYLCYRLSFRTDHAIICQSRRCPSLNFIISINLETLYSGITYYDFGSNSKHTANDMESNLIGHDVRVMMNDVFIRCYTSIRTNYVTLKLYTREIIKIRVDELPSLALYAEFYPILSARIICRRQIIKSPLIFFYLW